MTNHASTYFNFGIRLWLSKATAPDHASIRCCLLAMLVGTLCNLSFAGISDPSRYQTGVRNSRGERTLNPKQLERLLKSLLEKTGFLDMHFDETGFLKLGDRTRITGGSATARELLIAATDRARAIDLESHDHSPRVAFAQLDKAVVFISRATGAQVEVYPIQIDFSDFAYLRGDRATLAAFDIGFVVLHELAHAALGLHDSLSGTEGLGECEEYVNRIRRELGLPERQTYFARTFHKRLLPSEKSLPQAELLFARTVEQEGRNKTQLFYLNWEAERVGIVKQANVKPSSVASNNRKSASGAPAASAP